MHVGRSTKLALTMSGFTRLWLANQIGVSENRVAAILRSEHAHSRTIERLAAVFGLSPSEFIALGEKHPKRHYRAEGV